ncbi:polysaccharide biosynthesis C-terminal domain-containing protein [Ruminococcus sp.]|uniref:MATE family efflux transporter n=1 Tax=Ruminococcus sp. TaxID=41978 RepID=UPI0025EA2099|nr:polysaccharide biosynthesis C-terminal domain-containing protein [Ruminococcus sp.]
MSNGRRFGLKRQNFLKGSIILMISAATAKLLGAAFKIPLTNILGGIGMSYFSCAYSVFMPIYALTVTGLSSAVARMTAQSEALGMYANTAKVRRIALMLFSGVGLVGSLLIILLAKPCSLYFIGSCEAYGAVTMIAPSVFFGCIAAVERGYYEGMSNMYPTALSQAAEGGVKAVAGLMLCGYVISNPNIFLRLFPDITDIRGAAATAGVLGVTLSTAGAALFLGITRLFVRPQRGGEIHQMSSGVIVRELIATALPVGIGALVTNLTALVDMWTVIGCISRFGCGIKVPEGVTAGELPSFVYGSFAGIALTVFGLVPSVTNMLGKGALTCITSACGSGDLEALRHGTMEALLTAMIIALPAAAGIFVLAPELLSFLYPRQSDEVVLCIAPLRYLMVGMVCLCGSYPLFSMLQAAGKPSVPLKIMLAGTIVKFLGNLILIPFMGVDGAALSTTLCYVLILYLSLRIYITTVKIKIDIIPFVNVLYAGLMCGGSSYLTACAAKHWEASRFTVIGASAVVGGTVYIVLLSTLSTGRTPAFIKNK